MKENRLHPQEKQRQKLEELGSRLRQIRTARSLSLEEVSQKTKISTRLLNAIEEGKLEDLPEPVYLKGMIKQFADALGLPSAEFFSDFPTEINQPLSNKYSWQRLPATQLRPFHLYLIYIVLVIGTVNVLSHLVKPSTVETANLEISDLTIDQLQASTNPASTSQKKELELAAAKQPSAKEQNQAVVVDVKITSQSWLRVVVDGKTEFEGIIPAGNKRTWSGDEKVTLRAGNAGGVLVTYDDQEQKLGKPNQVQEVTYEADS